MKILILAISTLLCQSALAGFIRLEKDFVLTRRDPGFLSFVIQGPDKYASFCNLQAYINDYSGTERIVLPQGTEFKITNTKNRQMFRDVMIKHIISSYSAEIPEDQGYIKVVCSARKGTEKVPSVDQTASLFNEYISITK